MGKCRSLTWDGEKLVLLDQTKLPPRSCLHHPSHHGQVAAAIKEMKVRGRRPLRGRRLWISLRREEASFGLIFGMLWLEVAETCGAPVPPPSILPGP